MRKTKLNKTSILLVITTFVLCIVLGISRNSGQWAVQNSKAALGQKLFRSQGCSNCHATESDKSKVGPSLKGLFHQEKLAAGNRPVTEENVHKQLVDPYKSMPSFADRLSKEEIDNIISYLKTL